MGESVGCTDGLAVGRLLGKLLGVAIGNCVGLLEGISEGLSEGITDKSKEGSERDVGMVSRINTSRLLPRRLFWMLSELANRTANQ